MYLGTFLLSQPAGTMMARLLRSPAVEWAARRGATAQWVWVRHVSAYYSKKAPDELTIEHFDAGTNEGASRLAKLSEKSKELLAPHPYGVSRASLLNQLIREADLRLVREPKAARTLLSRMPDVAFIPKKFKVDGDSDLIFPAYAPKLPRRLRDVADYDPDTQTGAAAFQQFRDVIATLLERHPKV